MKRIALYYRVSTDDQTTEPQRLELLDYCQRRRLGGTPNVAPDAVTEYSDQISGAKFTRAGLDRLMADVRAHRIDTVLCVKMDRLGRSLPHLAQMISEFDAHGVALICTSQSIDTSQDNPAGRLQMHVLMAVAEFERSLIRERTKAGVASARARGKKLGRPAFVMDDSQRALLEDYRRGESGLTTLKQLAWTLGCSIAKAHALVQEAK